MALVPLPPLTIAHAHDRLAVRACVSLLSATFTWASWQASVTRAHASSSSSSSPCARVCSLIGLSGANRKSLAAVANPRVSANCLPRAPRPDRRDPRAAPSRSAFSGMIITTKSDRYAGATNARRCVAPGGGREDSRNERANEGRQGRGGRGGEAMA